MNGKVSLNRIIAVGLLLALVGAQTIPVGAQDPPDYTLTMVADPPEGGTTDPEPGAHAYPQGTTVSVSATPTQPLDPDDPNWIFVGWSGDHADECATGSVVMDADKSCTASFQRTYLLIASSLPSDGGSITTEPDIADYPQGYPEGTSVSISAVPNSDYQFDGWTGEDADECATGSVVMNLHVVCIAEFREMGPPAPGNDHWMADLSEAIQDRTLLDVVLPGTHDAGTYGLTSSSKVIKNPFKDLSEFTDIIKGWTGIDARRVTYLWARTQITSIEQQLNDGIRSFDLRFYKDGDGKFYIHHSMLGPTREEIFDDIEAFLSKPGHEKEIIILDLNNWENMDDSDHQSFVGDLYTRFGNAMIPRDDWDATLSEIWATGRQLVIRYQKLDENPQWVPPGIEANLFWTGWCSSWADTPDLEYLRTFLSTNLETLCVNRDELSGLSGIRTGHEAFAFCSTGYEAQMWLLNHAYICAIPFYGWKLCAVIQGVASILMEGWCTKDGNTWPPYRSILHLGRDTTPDVLQWVTEWWRDCQYGARDNLNIIVVDYYQAGDLLQTVKDINTGVYNTAPTIDAGPDVASMEGDEITLVAPFSDGDTCDSHSATIDWGDGVVTDGSVSESNGSGIVGGSHIYGDNGVFTITICVRDDFDEACDTLAVTVDNINPTAEIDESAAIPVNGNPTFIGHAGQVLDFPGRSTDPGSDDLTMSWDWDDGPPSPDVVTTYLVNPPDPDPFPSPSVQPRDVTDTQPHAFADACLYGIHFRVDDDDGGSAEDSSNTIIVGNGDKMRSDGYWLHEYRQNGATNFDQVALNCYLSIVGITSQVFDEIIDVSTMDKALDVLFRKQNGGSATEKFDRELLVAWLNFANGAIDYTQLLDTDKDGSGDTPFADVVAAAEAVRLDGNASDKEIKEQTNILHHINQMAED